MGLEVLIQTLGSTWLLAATLHTDQARLWWGLVKVSAVGGWRVFHDLSWLLVTLAGMGAEWWGLRGVGLFWGPCADQPTVERGGFLDGGYICRAYASESSSILTPHGQPLSSCCLCLYWCIITGQTAMVERCLRSFLLLVTFFKFLSPSFVLAKRLERLACWLSLAWGAACSLLHWFVSAEKKKLFVKYVEINKHRFSLIPNQLAYTQLNCLSVKL